jgi:type IV pilus assembly protein PilE
MRAKYAKGVTMIELLIVMVIVGVLMAAAYPSYLSSLRKSRRAEAAIAVETMAQAQERFFSRFRTYTSVVAGPDGCGGQACGLGLASNSSENDYYALTANGNATSYTVTATATNQQLKDLDCRTFTANNAGVRAAASSGGADTTDDCW